MTPVRAAVYNRYWPSMGGGERYSGMLAQVLAEGGVDVELVGHEPVDLAALSDHLALDLRGCRVRVVPDNDEGSLSELTGEYDLFVNGSYMSSVRSTARRSVYICYFPTPTDHDLATWRRFALRAGGQLARPAALRAAHFSWGTGWYPAEGGRRRRWIWTNGDAHIDFAPGDDVQLRFDLGRPGAPPTDVVFELDGRVLATLPATGQFVAHRVTVPARAERAQLTVRSGTFEPGGNDHRRLGAALSRLYFHAADFGVRERIGMRYPWLTRDPRNVEFLDSYTSVVAISQYTAGWIERLWQRDSELVYPPIHVQEVTPSPVRTKVIATVGRFLPPGHGHAKRQLEQVRAFGTLVRRGSLPGWTLRVIGGCEARHQGYLDAVRAAAEGLPVEIHPNAPRALVRDTLSTASIQWSATGFRETERRAPWAAEHFGITTVEAMAAGCVPVVIDKAGQREIVREGVDGFRWSTLEELTARTEQVAGDDALRARLAASAMARAADYSDEAFARRVQALGARYDLF